jgi:ribosomal-protein-alanine N-acetyltransferase
MNVDDIPIVLEIDRMSFPSPWPERSYRFELLENPAAYLLVAESVEDEKRTVVGYIGFWFIINEMHISTLAVHTSHRRRGIGDRLLMEAMRRARGMGAELITLEVRESNSAALKMYKKHGFVINGRRKNYYRDNNEDALVMTRYNLERVRVVSLGGER